MLLLQLVKEYGSIDRWEGELILEDPSCAILKIDNKFAIDLCKNPLFHDRSKHIDTWFHFISDCVEKKQVKVEHISSEDS